MCPGFINKPYDAIHKRDIEWVHFEIYSFPYPFFSIQSQVTDTRFHSEYRETVKSRAIHRKSRFLPGIMQKSLKKSAKSLFIHYQIQILRFTRDKKS